MNGTKLEGKIGRIKEYSSSFKLLCDVGIDYGNGKDVTASIIGFTNSKGQFIVLANFDDTTKIGKMIIDELDKMRTKSVDDFKEATLKAKYWNIVVKYQVNISTFVFVTKCLKKGYEAIKENNNSVNYCVCGKGFFTEEEFDTLKEVLGE